MNLYLLYDLYLPIEPRCPALDKRNICRQTHCVHMPSRSQIIERIEHEIEALEPFDIEFRIRYVVMMCFKFDLRVKFASRLFRDLPSFRL